MSDIKERDLAAWIRHATEMEARAEKAEAEANEGATLMPTQAGIEAAAKACYEEMRKDNPAWMPWEQLPTDSPNSVRPAWIRMQTAALEAAERARTRDGYVTAQHDLKATLATMKSAKKQGVLMSIWDRDIKAVEDAIATIEALAKPANESTAAREREEQNAKPAV